MIYVLYPYRINRKELTQDLNRRRFRADDPERKQWQDPDTIFSSIGLGEGMVFVDPGCGGLPVQRPSKKKEYKKKFT